MARRLLQAQIKEIREMRSHGFSLPEISLKLRVGQGTVWRHIQGVKISDKYKNIWLEKRKPSIRRKNEALKRAEMLANGTISDLSEKEKLLILASLYWAEGAKADFNLTNTDPDLINIFVKGLCNSLEISRDRLRLNVRIYEDMDREKCLKFWFRVTGLSSENLSSVNVLFGKKSGKLKYGMCRVRVTKGGDMLKYLVALRHKIVEIF